MLTAHAKMRKFEQPDELGAYDRWEMKLSKNVAPIVKEWADTVLFVNYKTFVIKDEKTDSRKAQGGRRVMYTNHHPCWDAKNRYGLPDEVDFDFSVIAPFIPSSGAYVAAAPEDKPQTNALPDPPKKSIEELKAKIDEFTADADEPTPNTENTEPSSGLPAALRELMTANNVTEDELRNAVAWKGYFTADTPILNYGEAFINGCLCSASMKSIVSERRTPDLIAATAAEAAQRYQAGGTILRAHFPTLTVLLTRSLQNAQRS